MKILIIGNCQANALKLVLEALVVGSSVSHVQLLPTDVARLRIAGNRLEDLRVGDRFVDVVARESDLILLQNGHEIIDHFKIAFPTDIWKVRMFPRILFGGFHPDMFLLSGLPPCPTGPYHSSIACFGWTAGFTPAETLSLFREDVYVELGFFEAWDASVKYFLSEAERVRLPLDLHLGEWVQQGAWMHTINHPALRVIVDIAHTLLSREGISCDRSLCDHMVDPLLRHPHWSVYPEIASHLGVPGEYQFHRGNASAIDLPVQATYDLEEFVRGSYKRYSGLTKDAFICERLASPRYQKLHRLVKASRVGNSNHGINHGEWCRGTNPYQDLPDHQFWRRAVERLAKADVDPVVRAPFKLKKHDKVATAGSCFAQHIARTLVKNGFNYFVSECADGLSSDESQRRNYGVFSARFGNLYTTRQLLQLFDRAFGRFTPTESVWVRSDGKLVDPFRPQIEPDGFDTVEDLERSREVHFNSVRDMFERLDVFVFTLGLTEAWRSRIDGAVYPLAPGVVAGEMDAEKYEFVNFTASEVTSDLQLFVLRLLRVNPRARVILTVSPVPLIATYEDRHVLVSTTYSKAALRVAAEEICQRNASCAYFPSYEIITGNYARSEYYESDLRSVKQEGVNHVMRLFIRHYGSDDAASSLEEELMRENEVAADIVCDEEVVDTSVVITCQ